MQKRSLETSLYKRFKAYIKEKFFTKRILGMTKIDDRKVKKMIQDYQKGSCSLKAVLEYISDYIYNFPKIIFNADLDECGDFYVNIIQVIGKLLKKYSVEKTKFTTWLCVVLRRKYLSWKNSQKKQEIIPFENEQLIYFKDKEQLEKQLSESSFDVEKHEYIRTMINSTPPKVRIVLKLYYHDFFTAPDLVEISKVFKIEIFELLSGLKDLYRDISQKNIKLNKLNNKLSKTYYQILELEYKKRKLINNNVNYEKNIEYFEIANKLRLLRERRNKLIKKRLYFRNYIEPKSIAELVGISSNAVNNLLFRGRKLLEEKLDDLVNYKKYDKDVI